MADYSSEQLGTTMRFVAAAKAVEKMLTVTDPEQASTRDAQIKEGQLNIPDLERVGDPGMHLRKERNAYNPRCEPGTLFIQDKVSTGGREGYFDNVVGEGWSLIFKDAANMDDAVSAETQHRFTSLFGMHSGHFSDPTGWKDVSGRYAQWFRDSEVQAVLVRPDYYIYGTAKTRDEIDELVKSALTHVSA